jgi:Domain of unknown function (DUF4232)
MSMFSRPQAIWLVVALATASWAAAGCASTTPGQPAATSSQATSAAGGATGTASPTSPGTPAGTTSAPAQSGTPSPSSSGPSSPASAPPSSAPPSSAPASGTGLAACRTGSLLISVDDTQANGGAGSSYYPLNFTNTSATTCAMYGYPGVSFAAAATTAGQQIGVAANRATAFARVTVSLAPGATAHAWLRVAAAQNYPAASCQPVTARWLRVYPPGETAAGYVGHSFSACESSSAPLLTILPVRPGKGVAGTTP